MDDRAGLDQFADAVGERDLVDVDQQAAVLRQPDLAELEPAQDGSAEAANREGGGDVLVRLADDEFAQPVLRPAGFEDGEAHANGNEDRGDDIDHDAYEVADDAANHDRTILACLLDACLLDGRIER